MKRRGKILAGIAIFAIAGAASWLISKPKGPPEPVYHGKPLSEWLTGAAIANGASPEESEEVFSTIGPEACPWMIWSLEHNQGSRFERFAFNSSMRLRNYPVIRKVISQPWGWQKLNLHRNTIATLSRVAPGTKFEDQALQAVLHAHSEYRKFDKSFQLRSIAHFTNHATIVVPVLTGELTNFNPNVSIIAYQELKHFVSNSSCTNAAEIMKFADETWKRAHETRSNFMALAIYDPTNTGLISFTNLQMNEPSKRSSHE